MIALLIQIPIVAAFMWYTTHMAHEFQAFIDKRDEQWQKNIERMACSIDDMSAQLQRNTAALLLSARKGSTGEISKQVLRQIGGENG